MKSWIIWGVYAVVLVAGSVGMFFYQIETFAAPESEANVIDLASSDPTAAISEDAPEGELAELEYDFGTKKNGTSGHRHEFVIRNRGASPLVITHYHPSCEKCVKVLAEPMEIPPGGEGKVLVEWLLKLNPRQQRFRQSVKIHTNDPRHSIFEVAITGQVVQPLTATPADVEWSAVDPRKGAEVEIELNAFFDDDLKILSHSFSDPATARHFELADDALPADRLETGAKSGRKLTLKVKPGLPMGALLQTLTLKTNLDDATELEIPVKANVRDNRVTIFGKDWNSTVGMLQLGAVKRSAGAKRTLNIRLTGEGAANVKLGSPTATPDFLKVAVNGVKQTESGQTATVEIEIPVDSSGNFLGTDAAPAAEVTIPTTPAEFGEIKFKVQFVIEG